MLAMVNRLAGLGLMCAAVLLVPLGGARAGGFHVLYNFCRNDSCSDGDGPITTLVLDAQGDLYGTTALGGNGTYCEGDCGTVYKFAPDGTESVLYGFCSQPNCADGQLPAGNLLRDSSGNFYGTAMLGGAGRHCPTDIAGFGTVFKLWPVGTLTVLYNFCSESNCGDGAFPQGELVLDGQGDLYGTTTNGGTGSCGADPGCGTVFKVAPDGTETVLHEFCSSQSCTDGKAPNPGVIADTKGDLFGTSTSGGNGGGVVFEVKRDGKEVVLYNFCSRQDCEDGEFPSAPLLDDGNGNFFGTTEYGGTKNGGTVFELTSGGKEIVLYNFCSLARCLDGGGPIAALIADAQGNLYGTTQRGGGGHMAGACRGCGVVFKLAPDNTESVLHGFCHGACKDGGIPQAALTANGKGELYGTASDFGANDLGGKLFKLPQ